ncbi:uncharacterized protein TrAFT101_011785 [Trichoderma asperellum]|uniref:uncharacterized protein n=1 Tax=Trichoderma asperellum TaxID=101201 RepID=UPI00332ACF4F|nr:hypothetical protein TrAFT101_011785 [Trichoderma asperellum]
MSKQQPDEAAQSGVRLAERGLGLGGGEVAKTEKARFWTRTSRDKKLAAAFRVLSRASNGSSDDDGRGSPLA